MTLFSDTELFTTGSSGKIIYDLPDSELILIDNFFTKEESDRLYERILRKTKWREYQMEIFDKNITVPRMISWYEDKDNPGADPKGPDWTYELLKIRSRVEKETQLDFNTVLLNLYRNGKDGVGWHSDKEHNTGPDPIIASVTLGETRMFKLRHKYRKDIAPVEIPLHHGSFLLMAGTTNSFWQHQVPKTARDVLPRINLTFRRTNRNI
ncbi:alpha-ketoglutarate-dependent dioxygenase AlkB family protein [Flavobacterium reichenbachii]|uniref:2OG-Fe(II) oxygenase n=1 Tax=Flavobacterium reichenbachii TaxID=362418 RepID=A0A085ZPW9_9FLAO|nr:alpha-ketoglutarate-dependent dioxygenase AlkB [Flavobacterium reichenbachii]KFF06483.1 2OG-Fe(II) oxygenase [Flavobacterium reichenbachii]OXB11041.1 alpha-ketoglutarate-dependent dioxygenase AlkB [Flavobacterium reichenbachii]